MKLIFLHGPVACGKLTTARALSARVGYPVFHNHLVVDLLTTVFPFGSEPFVRLREQMWLSVIEDAARTHRSVIFTFAPESTVTQGFPERLRAVTEDRGGRLCSVRLEVGTDSQEARLGDPVRHEFAKLTDVQVLRRIRAASVPVEQPPADLVIDTDSSDPESSAETIIAAFDLEPEAPVERYPDTP